MLSFVIKRKSEKTRKTNNIQKGKITYSDLNKPSKPFFSKKYRIAGKPDYIVEKNGKLLPVEYKSANRNNPLKNHVLQLASYCQLIEENYGCFVPYGILVYGNKKTFEIPFNPAVRYELESSMNTMRKVIKSGKVDRNHSDIFRCKNCSMQKYCSEKII